MTPKEKAGDLVCDFYAIQSNEYDYGINREMAKQCALIAVDEILHDCIINRIWYWETVKLEIKSL